MLRILSPQRLPFRHAGRMPVKRRAVIRLPRQLEKMQGVALELLLFRL
jgi:hypothetical protein